MRPRAPDLGQRLRWDSATHAPGTYEHSADGGKTWETRSGPMILGIRYEPAAFLERGP